ncbi:sensor histidine kinase [Niastella sp. OAS944]|uniref:sensor histidine kinase n=1 Tax=Niastella sp. OAS944 TaxID=2664089 RepID=UPI0034973B78|nr:two-component system phosphate regulon sensor histidine kinase PhoR [Chitinophagaceae bacterium OAS944]
MPSAKNLSPRQLAAFTAGIIAVPVAIGIFLLTLNWQVGLGSLVVVFAGGYWLILVTMERFIYRKIKLIYKLIYQTKATKKEEMYFKYILPQKSIDEVRADVEEWGERRIHEIEILQQNEAYRKEFLQNLAHEFKTPIFAIQGYVDTLLDGVGEEAIRKRFLENTAKNVDRLVNLMNDLDEISKLEHGEQLLAKQNFIIQDLIREVYDSLSIKTQAKNIRTILKKGCEAPITGFADKEKIKQVLINLVENATKYGKQNGSIIASIYDTDDQHVLVEISDDGIGIEEEHLPRIFERFYRTDTARSRDKGGSGLGLAICKHIIEAHGQSIHVRSTPDVGTTIGFTVEAKRD